jgi:hypothetical protein
MPSGPLAWLDQAGRGRGSPIGLADRAGRPFGVTGRGASDLTLVPTVPWSIGLVWRSVPGAGSWHEVGLWGARVLGRVR